MGKTLQSVIRRIIEIPFEFHSRQNISYRDLIIESRYLEFFNQIDQKMITDALKNEGQYVDQWRQWSEDNRRSSGWYFKRARNGKSAVGYYPDGDVPERVFSDESEACAYYIVRELEDLRLTLLL